LISLNIFTQPPGPPFLGQRKTVKKTVDFEVFESRSGRSQAVL